MGSFLSVVSHRLPQMIQRRWQSDCRELLELPAEEPLQRYNLTRPRSHCPQCRHKLRAWENIPLFSYLWLRGHCPQCAVLIPLRYPLLELSTGLALAHLAWSLGYSWQVLPAIAFICSLLCLAVIDWEHQLLPDAITLPMLWLGLAVSFWGGFTDVHSSLLGAMLGYLVFWLVLQLSRLMLGRDGLGCGDLKLLAMMGAWLGWEQLPLIVLFSALLGSVTGLIQIVRGTHAWSRPMPFGPCLALAGWFSLHWGEQLNAIIWQTELML